MRFLSEEGNRMPLNTLGAQHRGERKIQAFQHRTLLNVQLQIGTRAVAFAGRLSYSVDFYPASPYRTFQADAVLIRSAPICSDALGARERRRAEQAAAETCAFLVGPVDH